MKKKKIVKLIEEMIEDLLAGKVKQFWDAEHQPRTAERSGRVLMLRHILARIEAEGCDG